MQPNPLRILHQSHLLLLPTTVQILCPSNLEVSPVKVMCIITPYNANLTRPEVTVRRASNSFVATPSAQPLSTGSVPEGTDDDDPSEFLA